MISELLTRLRFLIFRKGRSELDEEIEFHLEQAITTRIAAGMDAAEARRQALIEFGGIEPAREQCERQRPGWWIGTVLQDLRYALRGFRRNPLFTISVLVTIALGIGATTAVFSVVDRILFRPLPYADPSGIVSLGFVHSLERQEFVMGRFYVEWQKDQTPFSVLAAQSTGVHNCDLVEDNPAQLGCISFQANFLPLFGISPVLGRNFLPEEDRPNGPRVVMISYGLWKGHYSGDSHILGRMINVDGDPVRIVGVLPRDFQFPTLESADIVSPFAFDPAIQQTVNGGFGYPERVFARLKSGVSVAQAYAQMQTLFNGDLKWFPPSAKNEVRLSIRTLRDQRDAGCAAGRVGSLRVCPCGLADCVRQRGRLDDGARSGAAAGACGAFGDRREQGQAHPPGADGSTGALVRGRPGGTCDSASTGHGVCPPCSDRNPVHQQSASRSAYCSVCGPGFVPLRSDLRSGRGARKARIGRAEREGIDVAQSCFFETQPGHGADRRQHHPAVRRGAVAAQLYEDRRAESRDADGWSADREGGASLVALQHQSEGHGLLSSS